MRCKDNSVNVAISYPINIFIYSYQQQKVTQPERSAGLPVKRKQYFKHHTERYVIFP